MHRKQRSIDMKMLYPPGRHHAIHCNYIAQLNDDMNDFGAG